MCYFGLNRNNSDISRDTIQRNLGSIYNIPIVGEYIESVENFGGHGGKIEVTDESVKFVHTTKPYGIVPESAKVYWELVTEDNGDENEYLTVEDAYLWTGRYPEAEMLLNQSFGQSMEIEIDSNHFENGVNVITDFKFSALCILGINKDSDPDGFVEPCFESGSIVAYSLDRDKFRSEFNQMVSELQFSLTKHEKGGETVEKTDTTPKEENKPSFSLTANQLGQEINNIISQFETLKEEYEDWSYEYPRYALTDIDSDNNRVIAFDYVDWDLVLFNYAIDGDIISVDVESKSRCKINYEPMESESPNTDSFSFGKEVVSKIKEMYENAYNKHKTDFTEQSTEFEKLQASFQTLKSQFDEVNEKYNAKLDNERKEQEEALFNSFANELTEEEMSEVKVNKDKYTIDEIQEKLFMLVGKKNAKLNFSKQEYQFIDLNNETKPKTTGKSYDYMFNN